MGFVEAFSRGIKKQRSGTPGDKKPQNRFSMTVSLQVVRKSISDLSNKEGGLIQVFQTSNRVGDNAGTCYISR